MNQQWEGLERRIVFGVYSIQLDPPTEVLLPESHEVAGTANNDSIVVRIRADGSCAVTVNGNDSVITTPVHQMTINGRRGNDVITVIREESAANPFDIGIYGGAGDDVITGSHAPERIYAGEGNDIVNAGNGRDTVYGEAGDDSIRGNAHSDLLVGGDGADTLRGDDGNDNISGGANSDRLRGSAGNDTLKGGGSRDFLAGEGDDDALYGQAADDVCSGGAGVDYLDGGSGDDALHGGEGDDNFNDLQPSESSDFDAAHDHQLVHFAVESSGSGGTLVMYTWGGDANLGGSLNGDDYFVIDSNPTMSGFQSGDFNYDGQINGDDYSIVQSQALNDAP